MAVEHADDATDVRDFATIRTAVNAIDAEITSAVTPLKDARHRLQSQLSGYEPDGQAWRAIVDETTPQLGELEAQTVSHLERNKAQLQQDREAVRSLGYQPGLPAAERQAAEAKAAHLHPQIETMSAAAVARAIKGAVAFNDPVSMAAWAALSDTVKRQFPNTGKVGDGDGNQVYPSTLFGEGLDVCERKTADTRLLRLRDELDEKLAELNGAIADITLRRAAHEPGGNLGSPLLTYQFGMRDGGDQRRTAKRYDPDAVKTRLGR